MAKVLLLVFLLLGFVGMVAHPVAVVLAAIVIVAASIFAGLRTVRRK